MHRSRLSRQLSSASSSPDGHMCRWCIVVWCLCTRGRVIKGRLPLTSVLAGAEASIGFWDFQSCFFCSLAVILLGSVRTRGGLLFTHGFVTGCWSPMGSPGSRWLCKSMMYLLPSHVLRSQWWWLQLLTLKLMILSDSLPINYHVKMPNIRGEIGIFTVYFKKHFLGCQDGSVDE